MLATPFMPSTPSQHISDVERAIAELRRGEAVCLLQPDGNLTLLAAIEVLQEETVELLKKVTLGNGDAAPTMLLSAKRAHHCFGAEIRQGAVLVSPPSLDIKTLLAIAGGIDAALPEALAIEKAPEALSPALQLVKLAELLPAALIATCPFPDVEEAARFAAKHNLLSVHSASVTGYKENIAMGLRIFCRAPVRLKQAHETEIIAFRSSGGKEHLAIVIGQPLGDNPVLIRVHSSCYTGDLLGSLQCDCGDQLNAAIALMGDYAAAPGAPYHGGIILYLNQEGRGIGLINKLRTYSLQAGGVDTVDANEILGFDDDERLFLPAAAMLQLLNVTRVALVSNNPRKAKGLEECGITVAATVPLITEHHEHNRGYLHTKAKRLGHNFGGEKREE